jgi:hypothetical protein
VSLSISRPVSAPAVALRLAIIGLILATGYIHFTLGGPLFLANAAGYAALAGAMALPLTFAADLRWLTRLALIGYALATIVGWAIMGPRFTLAYVAKGIEFALIVLVVIEQYREVGGPVVVARRLSDVAFNVVARLRGRRSAPAGI